MNVNLYAIVLAAMCSVAAQAADPRVFPDATPLTTWSVPDGKGVLWSAEPGSGMSMPLVVGDLVVVLVEPETVVAIDQKTGKERWRQELCVFDLIDGADKVAGKEAMAKTVEYWRQGAGTRAKPPLPVTVAAGPYWKILTQYGVPIVTAANYTQYGYTHGEPVTDGERIYVKFTSGSLAALTLDGKIVWRRRVSFKNAPTIAAAGPVVVDGKVIYKETPDSKEFPKELATDPKWRVGAKVLIAVDAATGNPIWRSTVMKQAFHDVWAGMSLATFAGKPVIITQGGIAVSATNGRILAEGLGHGAYGARGCGGTDVVVFGEFVVPLKASGEGIAVPEGDSEKRGTRATGLISGDRAYAWNEPPIFHIADLTGKVLFKGPLALTNTKQEKPFNGPGSIVGGFLIRVADPEHVAVVSLAGDKPQLVSCNPMGGQAGAPAAQGKMLFFRVGAKLIAIGKE